MNEKLVRRFIVVLLSVSLNRLFDKFPRCICTQMIISTLRRIPRSNVALEYDSVSRIEEHLGSATSRTRIVAINFLLEHQPDVANAVAYAIDLPWTTATFVERRTTEVPRNRRLHFI